MKTRYDYGAGISGKSAAYGTRGTRTIDCLCKLAVCYTLGKLDLPEPQKDAAREVA